MSGPTDGGVHSLRTNENVSLGDSFAKNNPENFSAQKWVFLKCKRWSQPCSQIQAFQFHRRKLKMSTPHSCHAPQCAGLDYRVVGLGRRSGLGAAAETPWADPQETGSAAVAGQSA